MENTEFKWGLEYHFLQNPRHIAYGSVIDIVYLINAQSDFERFSFENGNFPRRDVYALEEYWDEQEEYLKIVYRDVTVNYNAYALNRGYPHNSGEIDFSRNNEVRCIDWGIDELDLAHIYSIPYYSRISNPHFSYIIEFLNYCSYWRIANGYPNLSGRYPQSTYKDLENLVPEFVKEYKKK